jgi:hypothetical protein
LGFETTAAGQAARLQAAYRQASAQRRSLNLTQVYWYTWWSPYRETGVLSTESFDFSGLNSTATGPITPLPLLKAYADVAAQLEGCRKGTLADRCRR